MRFARLVLVTVTLLLAGGQARPAAAAGPTAVPSEADQELLAAAGLADDDAALLGFFRARAAAKADPDELLGLVRQLAGPPADRDRAAAELVSRGPVAVPALRHGVNDLADPTVAERAGACLRAIQGSPSLAGPAARLLTARAPAGAAEALLKYLPFADDSAVVEQVGAALAALAFPAGKPDPAVLKAIDDPVPLRRALAGAALVRADKPEPRPAVRKLLEDANPLVRLRVALALLDQQEVEAVPVLIDLLGELPPEPRRQAEDALRLLAGEWAPDVALPRDDAISRRIRRDAWAGWWRATEGPTLLAEFRRRTLLSDDRARAVALVRQLGAGTFAARERAVNELIEFGPRVVPLLREAAADPSDPERVRRARKALDRIAGAADKALPAAAARLLALRKPAGAAGVLLDFLPFTEDDATIEEVRAALARLAYPDGEPEPALVRVLADPDGARRATAAEALCRPGKSAPPPAVRKLLADRDPAVRLRVARALTYAGDKNAVPVLIELLGELPAERTGPAYEVLLALAGEKAPSAEPGDTPESRAKSRDAWRDWWKDQRGIADLSKLGTDRQPMLGYTLLVQVNNNNNNASQVLELGRDGKERWHIDGLRYPVDAHVLGGRTVLIAEWEGRRVTERTFDGKILWEKGGFRTSVVNAQRLPNGNTFIACNDQLAEYDRTGREVFAYRRPQQDINAGYKTATGRIYFLTSAGQCVQMDATGKELKSFQVANGISWTSGIDVLPNGHVLVAQHNLNKVAEYDAAGKLVWEQNAPGLTTVTRLADGHTLIASSNNRRAFELDRNGKTVWEHKDPQAIFRARRR